MKIMRSLLSYTFAMFGRVTLPEQPETSETTAPATDPLAALRPEPDEVAEQQAAVDAAPPLALPSKSQVNARVALVIAALDAATTPAERRRLRGRRNLVVTVAVPGPAWVKATEFGFLENFGRRWDTYARDGTRRNRDKAAVGNDEVANAVTRGVSVVGIAPDPATQLPAALLATADVNIVISPPTAAVVGAAIRACSIGAVPPFEDSVVAGLDFDTLTIAIRSGSRSRDVVDRLQAAARKREGMVDPDEKLPDLASAVEYGEARAWGLDLARDIKDFKNGVIEWDAVSRGAIFWGPPGLGKTLLVKMIARTANVPLIPTSVAGMFSHNDGTLGSVSEKQRAVFTEAAAMKSVCIIFLDEFDAMPDRNKISSRGRDWWQPIITGMMLLLSERPDGIICIAATNRLDDIDAAFRRPGRFETAIEIRPPDFAGTLNILRHHLGADLPDVDIDLIGRLLEGRSGADIMYVVRNARRIARQAGRSLSVADLRAAAAPEPDLGAADLWRLAIHESAHAVAAVVLNVGDVRSISLAKNATSYGRMTLGKRDELLTRAHLEDEAVALLAARAAEKHFCHAASENSGGSQTSDIALATEIVATLHASSGLGDRLTYLAPREEALAAVLLDRSLATLVERDLRLLEMRADALVSDEQASIAALANALVANRFLTGPRILSIIAETAQATVAPLAVDEP